MIMIMIVIVHTVVIMNMTMIIVIMIVTIMAALLYEIPHRIESRTARPKGNHRQGHKASSNGTRHPQARPKGILGVLL